MCLQDLPLGGAWRPFRLETADRDAQRGENLEKLDIAIEMGQGLRRCMKVMR